MKLALQRKANKKLVERKEEVEALLQAAAASEIGGIEAAVDLLKALETQADDLGLPITGEGWGERLQIKKKGGGMHFDAEQSALAAEAYARASSLHSSVTWHGQLCGRAKQAPPVPPVLTAHCSLPTPYAVLCNALCAALRGALQVASVGAPPHHPLTNPSPTPHQPLTNPSPPAHPPLTPRSPPAHTPHHSLPHQPLTTLLHRWVAWSAPSVAREARAMG